MPDYIRRKVPGGTYFFTVNLADRTACTLGLEIDLFRACYAATCREMPFKTDTIVVLPNHLHAIWKLPEGDSNFSERWRRIKGRFTHGFNRKESESSLGANARPRKVWQNRFWEHLIRDNDDLAAHRAYCWADPVHHDLVHDPTDWPFSSFSKRGESHAENGVTSRPLMQFPTGEFDEAIGATRQFRRRRTVRLA